MMVVEEECGLGVCVTLFTGYIHVHIFTHKPNTQPGHLENASFPLTWLLLTVKENANLMSPRSTPVISSSPNTKNQTLIEEFQRYSKVQNCYLYIRFEAIKCFKPNSTFFLFTLNSSWRHTGQILGNQGCPCQNSPNSPNHISESHPFSFPYSIQ